ncbi:MAG TPA: hypothetical protein VFZ79_14225 [Acidimicrobiales bacterium]
MDDPCVPEADMRRSGSARDPVDAVLRGDGEGRDLLDVAALVHDLRAAYDRAEPLARGPQLTAFTVAGGPHAERLGRKRHSMLTGLSAFLGTLTGKVVLGTAVTAASVGGLHAADVVDVPVLPDTGPPTEQHDGDGGRPDTAGADGANDTAEGNAAAAAEYTDAVRVWTDCVADAAGQGDADTRTTGGFDPRDACGDHPQPADFGLTELPAPAADAAADAVAGTPGATRPETPAPGGGAPEITVPSGAEAPAGGAGDSPAPETPAPGGGAPDIAIPSGSDAPAGGTTAPAGHRP